MEKKSAPAYLGLQGWLISESSQSIHLTLPQNCQKGNFSSSERGELAIKTEPYKNSHLKSIFFFPLFLSQKNPEVRKSVFDQNDKEWSYLGTELMITVSFSSCQRNLIKSFKIEGIIALITKMDLIFSWELLNGQKSPSKSAKIWFSESIFNFKNHLNLF